MKKILMISYYYPPLVDVGSLRALGFSTHLPDMGWEPLVLSVGNPDRSLSKTGDENPPPNVKVFRAPSLLNLGRIIWKLDALLKWICKIFGKNLKTQIVHDLFCIPDIFIGWLLPCIKKGLHVIRKYNIDVIYVSSKPFSSAFAGLVLKKITGKPLVLDFRDPASFPAFQFSDSMVGRFRRKIIARLEGSLLKHVDKLIVTTDETREWYEKLYPFLERKVVRIYNGFYLEMDPSFSVKKADKFRITYVGNYYYDLVPSDLFFMAMRKVIEDQLVPKSKIEFLYVGGSGKRVLWLEQLCNKYGIRDNVAIREYVPRAQVKDLMSKSALLLLRIAQPMLSTKLFEGLRDGVPLLAIINKGEAEKLIETYSKGSYVVTSDKVEDVADAIVDAYKKWEHGDLNVIKNSDYLDLFNKRALTRELATVLDDVRSNGLNCDVPGLNLDSSKSLIPC